MSDTQKQNDELNPDGFFRDTNVSMKTGHLVKDSEIISDGKYARIRIACNKQYEQDGETKNMVNYFNIMVSSNLEKAFNEAKDLKKGDWAFFKGEDVSKSVDTPQGYKETAVTTFAWEVNVKKAIAEKEQDDAVPNVA